MTESLRSRRLPGEIAAVLRGEAAEWQEQWSVTDVVDACVAHDVIGLLDRRFQADASMARWPADFHERIRERARGDAAIELTRRAELVVALTALADAGVRPLLLKGAALAYDLYPFPAARPRRDSDVIVRRDDVDAAREALLAAGYTPTTYSDGELLFRQFEMQKRDGFGIDHAMDIHWAISTQTIFADLFSYDELAADAIAVPALGPHARAAGDVRALILACVHPVMHHRNEVRLIWTYDIHLLASRLTGDGWRTVVTLAKTKGVAAIVAHGLDSARAQWGTDLPRDCEDELRSVIGEVSARYLAPGRGWRHEVVANVAHLPTWRDRFKLLREIALPSPSYMRRLYGVRGPFCTVLLPALYAHRLAAGAGKLLLGRK